MFLCFHVNNFVKTMQYICSNMYATLVLHRSKSFHFLTCMIDLPKYARAKNSQYLLVSNFERVDHSFITGIPFVYLTYGTL